MRRLLLILMPVLLAGCWHGYWHGYWAGQGKRFDLEGACDRCSPVAGTIESAEQNGRIEARIYRVSDALIRSDSGHRIKADTLRFNGATGAFETSEMRGYLLPDMIVVYTQRGESHDVSADHLETTRKGYEIEGGDVRKGGSAVRGDEILWITKE